MGAGVVGRGSSRLSRLVSGVAVAATVGALLVAGAGPATADGPPVTTWSQLSSAVAAGGTVTLGADLSNPAGANLTVGTTAVTLDLNGHSLSITGLPANKAGIEVGTGRSLTLENPTVAGGTLVATGGSGGAGIGGSGALSGGAPQGAGSITVRSGVMLTATGGNSAAGIGGGSAGDGSCTGGGSSLSSLQVTGGNVTANGGNFAAGIGSSDCSAAPPGQVTVSGGVVDATGGVNGAGIGGGFDGAGGPVSISGGTVTATGGGFGAGVGGGSGRPGGQVDVSAGELRAIGGDRGAGIGGGNLGGGGSVTVGGVVRAANGTNASAVGAGAGAGQFGTLSVPGTLEIAEDSVLRIPDGVTVLTSGTIQGLGSVHNLGAIQVNGGSIELPVEPNNYHLVFDLNGGPGATPGPMDVYADTVAHSGQTLPTPTPPPGYLFGGWFTQTAGGQEVVNATALPTVAGAGPATVQLFAQFFRGPVVTGLSPSVIWANHDVGLGDERGGDSVTITGSGFTGTTNVEFGDGFAAPSFTVMSDTTIVATTPPHAEGFVHAYVTNPVARSAASNENYFRYLPSQVTNVSPDSGPASGGTQVTLTGFGFDDAQAVYFNTRVTSNFTIVSNTQMTVTMPPFAGYNPHITVRNPRGRGTPGTASWQVPDQFTYLHPAGVDSVDPNAGPTGGGQSVTITGDGFTSATAVRFGASAASSFTVNSDTSITATTPPHAAGTVHVVVDNNGGTSSTSPSDQYTYRPRPAVTGVAPSSGTTGGGTSVTITGTGFTGATAVLFSTTATTNFTVVSDSQITVTTPPHAAGTVNLYVRTPFGTSAAVTADRFTYVVRATVTGLSPSTGPTAGGQTVTITGTGFNGATGVLFSTTAAASFTVNSTTSITAVTPTRAAGVVNVYVRNGAGNSAASTASRYTYLAPRPAVTGVAPNTGTTGGGTSVTITGTGFTGATQVRFSTNAATSFTVNSDTTITATSPPHAAGPVNVYVTTAGGTSAAVAADRFTYVTRASVTGVAPSSGTTAGGQQVTITGTGFTGATAVLFSTTAAPAFTVNSNTRITVTTPPHAAGVVNIYVRNAAGNSPAVPADRYTFVAPRPSVTGRQRLGQAGVYRAPSTISAGQTTIESARPEGFEPPTF